MINRMGFNNEGLEAFAGRLEARRGRTGVVGANIGANKDSADRIGDYVDGLRRLWRLADYFTVNISSPNTPGCATFSPVRPGRIAGARRRGSPRGGDERPAAAARPIFLKVAPDLRELQIIAICDAVARHGFEGIIAGNTTLSRPDTLRSKLRDETGGLSGAPLMSLSTRVLADFHACAAGRFPLIGAGGVASGADAYAKIRAGACAVQVYRRSSMADRA
ncbi:MAG: dihydroorotate dehydrogenase 2 [Caulobacteraceae bacterium]